MSAAVDLNMPEELSGEEKVAWLKKVGQQVSEETGLESGVYEQRETSAGQPAWIMWWPEE